jgi:hypothetical protein
VSWRPFLSVVFFLNLQLNISNIVERYSDEASEEPKVKKIVRDLNLQLDIGSKHLKMILDKAKIKQVKYAGLCAKFSRVFNSKWYSLNDNRCSANARLCLRVIRSFGPQL